MTVAARRLALLSLALAAALVAAVATPGRTSAGSSAWPGGKVVVHYSSQAALAAALHRHPAAVTKRIPALRFVELKPSGSAPDFAARLAKLRGIESVSPLHIAHVAADPGITPAGMDTFPLLDSTGAPLRTPPDTFDTHGNTGTLPAPHGSFPNFATVPNPSGGMYEWQWNATNEQGVPDSVRHAAKSVTIAVIDTGADLSAPDIAAKSPTTWDVVSKTTDVTDYVGHGTFVASLAAGAWDNNAGVAGFGGDAKLLVVKATDFEDGSLLDIDIAAAIVWATDHGANIINLSLGGPTHSPVEADAVAYAANKGVLIVAAAGNSYSAGNPLSFPAAVAQPLSSEGEGGTGLAVAASDTSNQPATYFDANDTFLYTNPPGTYVDPPGCSSKPVPPNPFPPCLSGYKFAIQKQFSNAGSYVSLAAPGWTVLGALSSTAIKAAATGEVEAWWRQTDLPNSGGGYYGFAEGTSFASPEVAGVAALVWGANPSLTASQVAGIVKLTAVQNPLHPGVSSASPPPGTWNENLGYGIANAGNAVAYAQSWASTPPAVHIEAHLTGSYAWIGWAGTGNPAAMRYRLLVQTGSQTGSRGPLRVLIPDTPQMFTNYKLNPGHTYRFAVQSFDQIGTPLAISSGVNVPYLQKATALSLSSPSGTSAHSPVHYHIGATLTSPDQTTPYASLPVAIESFDGYQWNRIGIGRTKGDGSVAWTFTLSKPGTYQLRARFIGNNTFASSVSKTVSVKVLSK